jgi:transcriptional regulator with XRE-family HTH domain
MLNLAVTEEILRNRLRENVRTRRNAASLTLKKASERAEMHWRHWQKIEAGQVNLTVQTLGRIAGVLGVDPADLLHDPPARADNGNGANGNGANGNGANGNGA